MDAACRRSLTDTVAFAPAYPRAAAEAAAKEAIVLRAWAARGGSGGGGDNKGPGAAMTMAATLARLTQALEGSLEAAAEEMARGQVCPGMAAVTGPVPRRARPYYAAWGGALPGGVDGEDWEEEEREGENGGEGGWQGEEEVEPATSVEAAAVELELCLEYGMLCRAAGRKQDFLSVAMSLVELAVFQSKSEFKRSRKKRACVCFLNDVVWWCLVGWMDWWKTQNRFPSHLTPSPPSKPIKSHATTTNRPPRAQRGHHGRRRGGGGGRGHGRRGWGRWRRRWRLRLCLCRCGGEGRGPGGGFGGDGAEGARDCGARVGADPPAAGAGEPCQGCVVVL